MHKKILTVLAVISCLLFPKATANDIHPSQEFYTAIHKGAAPVVIDGVLSEWTGVPVLSDPLIAVRIGQEGIGGAPTAGSKGGGGADGNYLQFERLGGGDWTGPNDHTSAVEIVWDEENVYFGFIVTDEYHENAPRSAWNGDSVQLMVATEARSTTWTPGVTGFLYNYALGGIETELDDPATQTIVEHEIRPAGTEAGPDTDTVAVVRRDVAAKKTYYEIRLPARALGLTPPLAAGMKFGLGMAINDGDELTPGQRGWGGLGAHSIVFGKTPSETALVTLSSQLPGTDVIFLSAIAPSITGFSFRATDKGSSIIDPATAKLLINGSPVPLTASPKSGGSIDFTYAPTTPPFASGSQNTYAIEVKDTTGQIASASASFVTPQYGTLTVADKVTPDTTKRGFIWRVHQNSAFTENSYSRAVNQLAGRLGPNMADPAAAGPALAPATPNTAANTNDPITFEIATFINMNIDPFNDPQGNIQPDDQMAGVPGLDPTGGGVGLNDGIAADLVYYVELTAGLHTFIVNSDDGFRTFVGKINDVFDRSFAGGFDGPRGATDTSFQVLAPEAGVYAFRTIFQQGGGGGNIELLKVAADGTTKVLLNDDVNGGPKTYRAATAANTTAVTSVTPVPDATGVNGAGQISVVITEGTDTVDTASIKLSVNGSQVSTTPVKNGNVITVSYTPTVPLAAGTTHNASIQFTAGGVARTENWSFKTTLFGPGTLFIEAEDFNFEHGKWDEVNPIGMTGPYPGGTYQDKGDGLESGPCVGTDHGIDYMDNLNNEQAIYRAGTPVEAGKRNGPAGLDRGTFSVEVNHTIGWTGGAEWMNYTRMFPAISPTNPGTYNVYARMAHGDAAARRGGILMTVQGDTTLCAADSQTTTELGRFSGPWTGGWDTWPDAGTPQDAILPMNDQAGSKVIVKLAGKQTMRFQFAEGAGDIDFLAFVPVNDPIPPAVVSLSPAPNSAGLGARPAFNAVIENRDLKVTAASLKLDGADVTETVTITATGGTVSFTPTADFTPGTSHSYLLSITNDRGETKETTIPFSISHHPFPAGTLFIEAEDFNFGKGQYITDQAIGMTGPYAGGAYQGKGDGLDGSNCDGTDHGIDYSDDSTQADPGNTAVYRPTTPVEAAKRNGPAGLNRQLFNVQVNHVLGWTGGAEWMNYTRDFPAGDKFYKVMVRMAHGDVNARRGGIVSRLASGDPAQCNDQQVFEELGTVTPPWTGGWDTWPDAGTDQDALIEMKDATGAPAIVKLGGKQTIRFQYAEGAGDIDYIAFLPQLVTGLEPLVTSLTPANNTSGVSVNGGAFRATIQDRDFVVGAVTLTLDGTPVAATVTKPPGNVTTVTFTPTAAFAAGSQHKYVLTVPSNSGNPSQVVEANFRATYVPLPAGTLFIEAEDFNFGKGQTITGTPIGMTGPYDGGAFAGRGDGLNGAACDGSDFGIDYMENNAINEAAVYRPNTSVEAGKTNGPAGLNRGTFDVKVNHVVGWTSGSEWMDYARDFPATPTSYKVYARMAHGDGAAGVLRGGILWKVSGDITLCADPNQTTEQLGTFQGPWTGGWDTFPDAGTPQDALLPMKDASGNVASVTLAGKTTLRFQYADAAGDIDYLAFLPDTTPPPGPRFTKTQVNANGSITIEWTGAATLETTTQLAPNATWTPVAGATSPFTFTPQAGVPMLFGRLKATP